MQTQNKINNKLTKKQFISKYIFLKILFGEFKIGNLVFSESKMSALFNTTNATVRVAYNNLIQRGILSPQKGKGYIVLKNIGSYMFDHYENLNKLSFKFKDRTMFFFKDSEAIAELTYDSIYIDNKEQIKELLDIFKIVFSKLEINEVTINKTYNHDQGLLINTYQYLWNDQIILSLNLKSNLKYIDLFNYKKQITLN